MSALLDSVMLWTVASNTLIAGLIAIVAFLVQRSGRGPSIAHGLYVLALIKLVTPPLMSIPVPVPVPVEVDRPVAESAVAPESPAATVVVGEDRVAAPASVRGAAPSSAPATAEETRSIAWTTMVTGTWLGSVVLALLLALGRAFRFHRILRHARPVDAAVQSDLRDLAARFGRSRVPRVEVVPGRVSPMLWGLFGRARVLLPDHLQRSIRADQRQALLAHEMAHYYRRDHWVRALEMVVSALYWWNPLVWWMRRQLHVVEEQCCDAWVVWAMPEIARRYADALIDTAESLSATNQFFPASATGAVRSAELKRRVKLIMSATTPRTHGVLGRVLVLGLALLLLPPALAQERDDDETEMTLRALRRAMGLLHENGETDLADQLRHLHHKIAEGRKKEGGDPDWEAMQKRIEEAVERGDLTREEANAKHREIRERMAQGQNRERGFTEEEYAHAMAELRRLLGLGHDLRGASVEIRKMIGEGTISGAAARACLGEARRKMGEGNQRREMDWEAIQRRIEGAVERGHMTREEADAKYRELKEKEGGGSWDKEDRGDDREMDWEGIKRKVEHAVENGEMTREEADALYRELKEKEDGGSWDKEDRGEDREMDWEGIKRRIEHAVENGEMTREEADAKYRAIKERMKR